jgi:LPS sulfotransferase NodH
VATADAVDRRVEALSSELVAANSAAGTPLNLFRAEHRREHLDEIEHALGPSRAR